MGAVVVVDALWGDSGKGKVAAWLARERQAAICVKAGLGTNAGHSLYLADGRLLKTSQLPLAGLAGNQQLMVGCRVGIDPELLAQELALYREWDPAGRLRIDARCPVILPEYREAERQNAHLVGTVGSTLSGTGQTQAMFALRQCPQAKDLPALAPWCADVAGDLNRACLAGRTVVVEGSQGTMLSLSLSPDYPCCTSGNCTASACAEQVGLAWRHLAEVVMVVKAVPSRVGTGPLPGEISLAEQDRLGIAEYGVRTGRRRRKSLELPWDLVRQAALLNAPTGLVLSFCDHLDAGCTGRPEPTPAVWAVIERLEAETGVPVLLWDRGKYLDDLQPLRH